MKRLIFLLLTGTVLMTVTVHVFSQSEKLYKEFGINAGGFTNFPANQDYLTKGMSALYVAPYLRIGRHEIMAGINYTVPADGLYYKDVKLEGRPGAIAGYKLYLFNPFGRENMFIHYSFQYLNLRGEVDGMLEKDRYFNNAIGLGYNLFFDSDARFGLFYTLDYIISRTGFYRFDADDLAVYHWTNDWAWNNLSTQIGVSFKLMELRKKLPENN